MTVKQISTFLENKPGALAAFTKTLQESNIDLHALSLAETEDFGIVRVIVDDPLSTVQILKEPLSSRSSWRTSRARSSTC